MKIGVIGAGSWGTAIAALLAENGAETALWAFEPDVASEINKNHRNPLYMSQARLPARLKATSSLEEVARGAGLLVNVVPSHLTRSVWKKLAPLVKKETVIVNCSKGLEMESGKRHRVSQVEEPASPRT